MNWSVYTSMSVLAASIVLGSGYNTSRTITGMLSYIVKSRFNILVMVNLAYNMLFLFGKLVQYIFFGKLRDIEYKNINDRLLNYILIKILFIGAMMEPGFDDLVVWTSWFSILGFMKIFSLLARDRFEYLTTFNPNTSMSVHGKLLTLLSLILVFDIGWFYFIFTVFHEAGYSALLLLTFECFTLLLDTLQTLIKYVIHLIDLSREGVWEQRGIYIYYTEFCTDTLVLAATLGHYIQILLLHGISFTFIDAILFLNMRVVFNNLREKITAYRNYRKLAQNMKNRYPDVPPEELSQLDDVCAICHDKMDTAKKLPCSHIFHHSCLRSWLENHHNCPTCRYSLIDTPSGPAGPAQTHNQPNVNIPPHLQNDGNNGNEVFRFNGTRWFSWLPTIQVVHGRNVFHPQPNIHIPPELIQRVQEVFPDVSPAVITQDLMQTHSVELTIENFLEGRMPTIPQTQQNNAIPQQPIPNNNNFPPPSSPQTDTSSIRRSTGENNSPTLSTSTPSPITTTTTTTTSTNTPLSSSAELPKLADVFATSSQERQSRLQSRKQQMIEIARRQYLEKMAKEQEPQPQPEPIPVVEQSIAQPPKGQDDQSAEKQTDTDIPLNRSFSSEDPVERRRLMLEAAQRRQGTKKDQ